MQIFLQIFIFLALLALGFFFGHKREKKHYQEINLREKALLHISLRVDERIQEPVQEAFLVTGNVVIANDFFKNFVASIKNMFGGRLSTFESLMDRARREAILRMKEQAVARGAHAIVHCRIEMCSIDRLGVEVMAAGTAIRR